MAEQYLKIMAVTNDEFDDLFWSDDGVVDNIEEIVCEAWNDVPSDYYNFTLERVVDDVIPEIKRELEKYEEDGIKELPISKVKDYLEMIQND